MSLGSRRIARALAAGALSAAAFGAFAAAAPAALADNSGVPSRPQSAVEPGVGDAGQVDSAKPIPRPVPPPPGHGEATVLRPPPAVPPPPGAGLDAHIPRLPEVAATAG
jgi:hypothetical protein